MKKLWCKNFILIQSLHNVIFSFISSVHMWLLCERQCKENNIKIKKKTIILLACRNFIKQFITEGLSEGRLSLSFWMQANGKVNERQKNEGVGSLSLISHLILLLFRLQLIWGICWTVNFCTHIGFMLQCTVLIAHQRPVSKGSYCRNSVSPSVMSLSKRKKKKD